MRHACVELLFLVRKNRIRARNDGSPIGPSFPVFRWIVVSQTLRKSRKWPPRHPLIDQSYPFLLAWLSDREMLVTNGVHGGSSI